MNDRKIQVWLRPDQARCILETADYATNCINQVLGNCTFRDASHSLASRISRTTIANAVAPIRTAIEKVTP